MLFWVVLILMVSCVGGFIRSTDSDAQDIFACLFGLLALVMVVMVLFLVIPHIGLDGEIAKMNQEYESLVYQIENDVYDNDNDIGLRQLYTRVETWNKDLAYHKEVQDDFWIGIFYPNIYDQFKLIELPVG